MIILILLLVLFIYIYIYKYEYMDNTKNERIELSKLPRCRFPIDIQYLNNYNIINNDGSCIYQNMLNPTENKSIISGVNNNLTSIVWNKSMFNWKDEAIPLEIKFMHTNPDTNKMTNIIFPVKLVDTKEGFGVFDDINKSLTEIIKVTNNSDINKIKNELKNFRYDKIDLKKLSNVDVNEFKKQLINVDFNNISKEFKNQTFTPDEIKSFINLNSLLTKDDDIPDVSNKNKVVNIELCAVAKKIIDQEYFYYTINPLDDSLNLISNPQPYNKKIGNIILEKLTK